MDGGAPIGRICVRKDPEVRRFAHRWRNGRKQRLAHLAIRLEQTVSLKWYLKNFFHGTEEITSQALNEDSF